MWKLTVGVATAKYIDSQGKIHISRMVSGLWQFQGRLYKSPLDAFKQVEDGLQKRVSGL